MTDQQNIITIATGKALYFNLAVNLARSFIWWHAKTTIQFYIITDLELEIPADLNGRIIIKKVKPEETGIGFSTKLYLDQLAPAGKTIFIDSDCLIFGNLEHLFNRFKSHAVSVVGGYIAEGEWFGDVKHLCQQFNVLHIPKFNGGIYYLEKGPLASSVYETARKLEKKYDEIGFVRLRNQPNDEVLMALAMQLHNQTPVTDDGTIMSDPLSCPGVYKLNVIKGNRWLVNPPLPSPLHQSWYPFQKVSPLIVHFLGYFTEHYPYKKEAYRLKKALNNQLGFSSEVSALLAIQYPDQMINWIKNSFRPVYRSLFGTRKVKRSERVI